MTEGVENKIYEVRHEVQLDGDASSSLLSLLITQP